MRQPRRVCNGQLLPLPDSRLYAGEGVRQAKSHIRIGQCNVTVKGLLIRSRCFSSPDRVGTGPTWLVPNRHTRRRRASLLIAEGL